MLQQLRPVPTHREIRPRQITNLLTGRRAKLYGAGANVRDWIRRRSQQCGVADSGPRHVGFDPSDRGRTGSATTLSVLRLILELMGHGPDDFESVTDRAGHDLRYAIDSSALRDELGWTPERTDFTKGLGDTIDWYRDNEWWWQPLKRQVEDEYAKRGQ